MKQPSSKTRRPRSLRQEQGVATPAVVKSGLALSLSTAMLVPLGAMAQQAAESQATQNAELPAIKVQATKIDPNPNAEVGAPYKARTSADTRRTRPIAETPQTMNVITKSAIDDYGQTDLAQVLLTQPGITLGTGENGNMFGDNYNIRGQSAKSDTFVDDMRDPGMSTRETFATEQIEVTKGPSSSFAGRGSSGGAINMITKQATLDYDFTRASVGFGTDSYQRHTLDMNKAFGDNVAVRVNALWADQDIPDRDPATRKREGIALAGLLEVNKDLSVMADFYHLKATHKYPDAGTFLVGTNPTRRPTSNSSLVGAQNDDFLDSTANIGSLRVRWAISPTVTLNSLTRYGKNDNAYAFYASQMGRAPYANNAVIQSHTRFQESTYFAHQDNLRWDTDLGNGRKNEFVATIEYSDNHAEQGTFARTGANANSCGSTSYCIGSIVSGDDIGTTVANLQSVVGGHWTRGKKDVDWRVKTIAVSAMDTYDITDRFTGFAGLRVDRPELTMKTGLSGASSVSYKYSDTLTNYWAGLSYKLNKDAITYLSYGTAQDINGGEPDSGTSANYGGLVALNNKLVPGTKPETARNVELGIKWNLLDQKLLATAAAFRTDKTDLMQATGTYTTEGTTNSGGLRIQGVEFGLVGNVTEQFSVQAGAAFMSSEMTKSHPSAAAAQNVGHELANFANRTASVLGRYQATRAFAFGGVARYASKRCGGQPDTGVSYSNGECTQPIPSYTVYDAFAEYTINKRYRVRANVLNATNKEYYTAAYQTGFFLYKGDARRVYLTLDIEL